MSNVVNINGDEVLLPREACEELIVVMEELLERARSGDLHGIHAVLVHGDQSISTRRTLTPTYKSIGAVFVMGTEMVKEMP